MGLKLSPQYETWGLLKYGFTGGSIPSGCHSDQMALFILLPHLTIENFPMPHFPTTPGKQNIRFAIEIPVRRRSKKSTKKANRMEIGENAVDKLMEFVRETSKTGRVNFPDSSPEYGNFLKEIGLTKPTGEEPSLWNGDIMVIRKFADSIIHPSKRSKFKKLVLEKPEEERLIFIRDWIAQS